MKPHLFLNNPRGESKAFNVNRKIEEKEEEEDNPEKPAEAYAPLFVVFSLSRLLPSKKNIKIIGLLC